jgi:hypothetical protein
MKLLDAVNLILPKLGEHAVTSLDQKHPTIAVILPEVENRLRSTLLKGWWFNSFVYKAYPDSEKHIKLGVDTLSFTPLYVDASLRGLDLYNPDTMSFEWDEPVEGMVRQYVEFDLLPESAAQFIFKASLVSIYATDIGLTAEVNLWAKDSEGAYSDMLAEHLRNQKHTTKNSRRWANIRRALRS